MKTVIFVADAKVFDSVLLNTSRSQEWEEYNVRGIGGRRAETDQNGVKTVLIQVFDGKDVSYILRNEGSFSSIENVLFFLPLALPVKDMYLHEICADFACPIRHPKQESEMEQLRKQVEFLTSELTAIRSFYDKQKEKEKDERFERERLGIRW